MHLEVNRLATSDDRVGDVVLVDLGALFELAEGDVGAFSRAMGLVQEAAGRGGRQVIWVRAPASDAETPYSPVLDASVLQQLGAMGFSIQDSTEPVMALEHETMLGRQERVSIVTAYIERRQHDLWSLSCHAHSILDVASGRLWRDDDFVPPLEAGTLSFSEAIISRSNKTRQDRYFKEVHKAISGDLQAESALPIFLQDGMKRNRRRIDTREGQLLGVDRPDSQARNNLRRVLDSFPPKAQLSTGYVCAKVDHRPHQVVLLELLVLLNGSWQRATQEKAAVDLLNALLVQQPQRWFGPQLVGLLVWMIQHGLTLPHQTMDPAWMAFALHPERPIDLASVSPRVLGLPPRLRRWLADHRREFFAYGSVADVAPLLPELDQELTRMVQRQRLHQVIEQDLGETLPVLAAVEARGVMVAPPIGFVAWPDVAKFLWDDYAAMSKRIEQLIGRVDFVQNAVLTVRSIEKKFASLLPEERQGVRISAQLDRYLAVLSPGLDEVQRGRELGNFLLKYPVDLFAAANVVRAVSVPSVTGRLSMREPALQSMPKRSTAGRLLRSALVARPGHLFTSADYNAFEVRIAADLSGDSILTAACQQRDAWSHLGQLLIPAHLQGHNPRELAKAGVLAYFYGQSRDGFWKSQPSLARRDADFLFNAIETRLSQFVQFRDSIYSHVRQHGYIQTRGGWLRFLEGSTLERQRQGFSTLIQGLAADIFRRVLRALHVRLVPYRAFIVHHLFDEIIVEAPEEHVETVKDILRDVMETTPTASSPLMTRVPLFVKAPKTGRTWADLL